MSILKLIWNFFFGKSKPKEEVFQSVKEEFDDLLNKIEEPIIEVPEEITEDKKESENIELPIISDDEISKRNNLKPERFENESFEDYKRRRRAAKVYSENRKVIIHESKKTIKNKLGMITGFTKGKTFKGDANKLAHNVQ